MYQILGCFKLWMLSWLSLVPRLSPFLRREPGDEATAGYRQKAVSMLRNLEY